jgi:hypothetical protein
MVNFYFVAPTLAGGVDKMLPLIGDEVTVIKSRNFIQVNSGFDYAEPRQLAEMCSSGGLNVKK